jgi:hypothetical protein
VTRRSAALLLAALLAAMSLPDLLAADPTSASPVTAAAVADLIEAAEAARSRAAELSAEWLETRALIEESRRLAASGELQQAAERADRARQQGELAAAQAERESTAWRRRVIQ